MKNHNIPNDNEAFARRVTAALDEIPLSPKQVERLRSARVAALEQARAPVTVPHSIVAGPVHWLQERQHHRQVTWWLVGAAAVVCLAVTVYWHSQPDQWDDDVDVQLLAGDLPPDAYLDEKIDVLAR